MSPPPTRFAYRALPMRVVFGAGSLAELGAELDGLGVRRVLVLCTPTQRELGERVAAVLEGRAVGVYPHATMHVPLELATAAAAEARRLGADACVAVGGGSTIGLGKAIALTEKLPVVAVPTTYAGSEMTTIWGLTDGGRKRTGRDPAVLPVSVVYDPELTLALPPQISATSGVNAIAHAAEALYAPDISPIIALMAADAVTAMAAALPVVVAKPDDVDARSQALYGAWLCGACLGATTMSLHHKLCHLLGGTYGLPHAETHTVVLPHVLAFNAPYSPDAMAALSTALGPAGGDDPDPARAVYELAGELGTPSSLRELGLQERDLDAAVGLALADPYANPRPITAHGVREVLTAAFEGRPPGPIG